MGSWTSLARRDAPRDDLRREAVASKSIGSLIDVCVIGILMCRWFVLWALCCEGEIRAALALKPKMV